MLKSVFSGGRLSIMITPMIAVSPRLRSTPFTKRVMADGVKAFTVYNRTLLATEFESLQADYWHLCRAVQVWDVGAERQVDITGPDATSLVQWMTPRPVAGIALNQCAYLPLADERGKLMNDPVAIRLAEDHWWLSVADSDVVLWAKGLARGAGLDVHVHEPNVWPLAVQGPKAEPLMARVLGEEVRSIRFFRYARIPYRGAEIVVSRSGWSKQGGFEIFVDDIERGLNLYDDLFASGKDLDVRPGCPNLIERMEASLMSFGNDMTSDHSVLEAGLESFVDLEQELPSLSHESLRAERERGPQRRLCGLMLDAPEGPRPYADQLLTDQLPHRLGSQVYSPRYAQQLATAMIEEPILSQVLAQGYCTVRLEDGQTASARISRLPFDFSGMPSYPPVSSPPELSERVF